MRKWIQYYLGIEQVHNDYIRLSSEQASFHSRIRSLHDRLSVTNRALGRIIAHFDPNFGRSEFSTERHAESDKIGDEVMRKLMGEHLASKKINPDA